MPDEVTAPVRVKLRLLYRKFDSTYMEFVDQKMAALGRPIRGHEDGQKYRNELPVILLAEDQVTFPVEGVTTELTNPDRDVPQWQRWNGAPSEGFSAANKCSGRFVTLRQVAGVW